MFLFLGGETTINSSDVIGIFDIEKCSADRVTADFLNQSQKKGQIVNVSEEMPKAFVVCEKAVYITNVASSTIIKRGKEF